MVAFKSLVKLVLLCVLVSGSNFLYFSCDPADGTAVEVSVNSVLENNSSYPDGFYPADVALVQVAVDGDTKSGPGIQANLDVVFLIDESGSTASTDNGNIRRQVVSNLLDGFDPSHIQTNVIFFNDAAEFVCSSITSLSTEFGLLKDCIDNLPSSGGYTNMADAIAMANNLLINSTANNRVVVLFTDGYPESASSFGYDILQDISINNSITIASEEDIVYYPVHLIHPSLVSDSDNWTVANSLMTRITNGTGGTYFPITDASEIGPSIENIVNEAQSTVHTKGIYLDLDFNYDDKELVFYPSQFITSNLEISDVISSTGKVKTEVINVLQGGSRATLTSAFTFLEPLPAGVSVAFENIPTFKPTAKVWYHNGDGNYQSKIVDQVIIKWLKPPSVLVKKTIEPNSKELNISVTSYVRDEVLKEVLLWEAVSRAMEVDLSTLNPHPNHIFPASMGSQNTFDYFSDVLVYNLGDFSTYEKKEVKFNFRYFGPQAGNVHTDLYKPPSILYYNIGTGPRESLSVAEPGDWFGDLTYDAAMYLYTGLPPTPDFHIDDQNIGRSPQIPSPIIVNPISIWIDAEPNGWLPPNTSAALVTEDDLVLNRDNRIWFNIWQVGDTPPLSTADVKVFIKDQFEYNYEDWTDLGWIELGSRTFTNIQNGINDYVQIRPLATLTPSEYTIYSSLTSAYIKVQITYPGNEIRQNNNTTFKKVTIQVL